MRFKPQHSNTAHASRNNGDSFLQSRVQPKLAIGQPGDRYEVEADRTADSVVSKLKGGEQATQPKSFLSPKPVVQPRKQDTIQKVENDKEQGDEQIQEKPLSDSITPLVQMRLPGGSGGDVSEETATPIQAKCADCEAKEKAAKGEDAAVTNGNAEQQGETPVQAKCDKCAAEEEKTAVQTKCAECEQKEAAAKEKGETPVQAKCDKCEAEKEAVQTKKPAGEGSGKGIESQLSNSKGGGSAMAPDTQSQMSEGFGTDFSNVRIHTDANAVQMNKELGSHAFTNGNDIYFNQGKYDPGSDGGKHLLAHELTHTVQQGASTGKVAQKTDEQTIQKDEDPCAPPKEQGSKAAADAAETTPTVAGCTVSNPPVEQPPEGQEEPDGEDSARDIEATEGGPVDDRQSNAPPADENAPDADPNAGENAEAGAQEVLDPCQMRQQQAAGGAGGGAAAAGGAVAVAGAGGAAGAGAGAATAGMAAAGAGTAKGAKGGKGKGEKGKEGDEKGAKKGGRKGDGEQEEGAGGFLGAIVAKGVSPLINPEGLGEDASPELLEERELQRLSADDQLARAAETQLAVGELAAGGVSYKPPKDGEKEPQLLDNHRAVNEAASGFLSSGAAQIGSILNNGMTLASGIRSSIGERKGALLNDIALKRQTTRGFFRRQKNLAKAKAARAKTTLAGQHAATLMQIQIGAMMAELMVNQTQMVKSGELSAAYMAQLLALDQAYATGYNNLIAAGTQMGNACVSKGNAMAEEYRSKAVYKYEGFWDGYITYNRQMARVDAAKETGKQYKEGMESQAKAQADQMMCGKKQDFALMAFQFQKGNENVQCALLTAQESIKRQKDAAVMQANFAFQELTKNIDQSLQATLVQFDEKEAFQLQMLNDYGIRQSMAIEKDGEQAVASAMEGVNKAVDQLLEFLKQYKSTIEGSEAPNMDLFMVTQGQIEAQFGQSVMQTEMAITTTVDTTQLSLDEGAAQAMGALQQMYDDGITDGSMLASGFASTIDGMVSSGTSNFALLTTNATGAISGEQQNGVNIISGVVAGVIGLFEQIKGGVEGKFVESETQMRKGMQTTIDTELHNKICSEAQKAAEEVQPWWKSVLKVLLVIVVIVVVALVIGPAVIGAVGAAFSAMAGSLGAGAALAGTIGAWAGPIIGGAIVGALSGAVIQVGNNLIDNIGTGKPLTWDSVTKGVWGAMIAGAIGGALGGFGGQFAQVLFGRMAPGLGKFAAEFAVDAVFDIAGGVLGDLAAGNPITWESIVMGLAIGSAVNVSMGGMGALAKNGVNAPKTDVGGGSTPRVNADGTPATPRTGFKNKAQDLARKIQDFQGRMMETGQNFGGKAAFGKNAPSVATTKQGIIDANQRIQDKSWFGPKKNKGAGGTGDVDATTTTKPQDETTTTTKNTTGDDITTPRPETETTTPKTNADSETPKVESNSDLKPKQKPNPQDEMASPTGKETFKRRQVVYDENGQVVTKPRKGQRVFNADGERIMTHAELKAFRKQIQGLSQNGLEVKIVIDKFGKKMPGGAAAAFDPETGTIYLRNKPTMLELLHEGAHAKQWVESGGAENYAKHGAMAREEYVFREIMRNKQMFNDAEIYRSQRVIYKYRNGDWPPKGWKAPNTPDYQSGVDWKTVPPRDISRGPSRMDMMADETPHNVDALAGKFREELNQHPKIEEHLKRIDQIQDPELKRVEIAKLKATLETIRTLSTEPKLNNSPIRDLGNSGEQQIINPETGKPFGTFVEGQYMQIKSKSTKLYGSNKIKLHPTKTTTITGTLNDVGVVAGRGAGLKGSTALGENPGGINILRSPKWEEIQARHKHLETTDPVEYWHRVREDFWEEANGPWLKEAIARGDNIRLVSDPNDPLAYYGNKDGVFYLDKDGNKIISIFGREVNLLRASGYTIGDDGVAFKP